MKDSSQKLFKNTFFWLFTLASFISTVGTWLFSVGASWMMTDMDASPTMIALVQTATFIPLCLLALPAGAVAELYNQQRVLIISQAMLVVNALAFAFLVTQDQVSIGMILGFTFLNGVGAAFARPILAALIPQIVAGRHQLRRAIDINGVFYNVSRTVGPVLGGWLISAYTLDLPFWIDAITFLAVIGVISFWKDRRHTDDPLPREPLTLAMGDTIRFLRYTPALYHSIYRAVLFFFAAAALWALLPILAKDEMGGNATTYGIMLGGTGLGALGAAFLTDTLTDRWGANRLTFLSSLVLAGSLVGLGLAPNEYVGTAMCLVAGVSWQFAYTALMTSAQYSLPDWYQARGMSLFLMTMSVGMGIGSILWGLVAELGQLSYGFYAAAGLSVVGALIGRRFRLDQAADANLEAATDLCPPEGISPDDDSHRNERIMVQVNYVLGNSDPDEAIKKISQLRSPRYRNGARHWHLVRAPDDDGSLLETYTGVSTTHYCRQLNRVTEDDRAQEREIEEWLTRSEGSIERSVLVEADLP